MAGNLGDSPLGRDVYVRTTPFSNKRLLEPPRVHIPPPALNWENRHHTATLSVERRHFEHTTNSYGDPSFLNSLNELQMLVMEHKMHSWTYEMRRLAHSILPYLFLGPVSAAKDPDFIRRAGITLVIATRSSAAVKTRPNFLHPNTLPAVAGLETMTCDFEASYDLFPKLRPTIKAMNDHLQASCDRMPIQAASDIRGRILVYCESGNGRSANLIAAYLIAVFGVSAISALHIIQSQRFCIAPDDAAKQMLVNFERIVEAERQVSRVNAASTAESRSRQQENNTNSAARPAKRGINELDDMDINMDELDGVETMTRQGIAPYADSMN
ncbi:hypothetical protein PV08_06033 [Exophiala spinifera]|uniref:Tyrosine specific protein phosphatases domain-containing protein n=1 Tax=Exophiala spinifera TaxID=91928 RepID=A0A0D1ZT87_9EURO|nr:uncharacterized protein PV08_06033 [Exophiala spinifera]KIW15982.1 hypothetical protein PV08_06033 [Exophiala spinifera]